MAILEKYVTPKILEPDYKFSESGTYRCSMGDELVESPLTQAIYGSHVLEAAEHCSRCPDNSDVADVEGFRRFAAISVK